MTELPLVVRMTVDSSQTDYDLSVESNTQNIELENETVIETGGSHVPVYEGDYVVDRGLSPVVLETNGKRMTDDVTVNALAENYISGNDITVNANGRVSSFVSVSAGYSPNVFAQMFYKQLDTQAGKTVTPSTSEQIAVARGKYTLGDVKVGALAENSVSMTDFTVSANSGIAVITSTVTRGYSPTTKSATTTVQLPTQARATITPTTSEQTAVAKGKYTTGAVKVRAIPTGTRGTPTATKGTVSNHSVSVTPSVTNTTGYITGGTINGTAVSVSASELVSGTYNISANGTYDISNYQYVEVEVVELTEQTIATSGAVSQQLDIKTLYHFTGSLTSLTVTLATTTDIAEYHFDFNSGSTAPTLNMPQTVIMPDSFQVEANKHYEVDILNNYGTVKSWSIS